MAAKTSETPTWHLAESEPLSDPPEGDRATKNNEEHLPKPEPEPKPELPLSFLDFLDKQGLSPAEYILDKDHPILRSIRVNPRTASDLTQSQLEACLGTAVVPVAWLPGFYQFDPSIKIAHLPLYKEGKIYGIDVSSGVAVHALDIKPTDQVLDLCCAPGGKLCFIADLQGTGPGTVTGVDIEAHRLATCRSLTKKHKLERVRLFLADGTTFNVHAPSAVGKHRIYKEVEPVMPRKRPWTEDDPEAKVAPTNENLTKRVKPFHATRLLRSDPQLQHPDLLYDKVLVDAECSHEGSIFHIQKFDRVGWDNFETKFNNPERIRTLESLQQGLISNGFKMLKPGGIMVYSTCSFACQQNESIVAWLLEQCPDAILEAIPGVDKLPVAPTLAAKFKNVDLRHVVRFSPRCSQTSGFFAARIRKRAPSGDQASGDQASHDQSGDDRPGVPSRIRSSGAGYPEAIQPTSAK
ncbi:S-adenosyl-L-methionine-dependent methyltransferase [Polychytrium aggregatum]|uniref:S-adenosyl-L-methionine-dependent methyltransferase n=1 Tax=Polychytrium aggregatum TaxID=110093 RepID=UPI0022FEE297|nr:S-adenosyl-L-methionine-dependent methyltransferase [Polychytrium aggregatum]KAI9205760.1 S-adenosyl-L-methionine-dependent methyltransferase [Polychytrium aggregatum]